MLVQVEMYCEFEPNSFLEFPLNRIWPKLKQQLNWCWLGSYFRVNLISFTAITLSMLVDNSDYDFYLFSLLLFGFWLMLISVIAMTP